MQWLMRLRVLWGTHKSCHAFQPAPWHLRSQSVSATGAPRWNDHDTPEKFNFASDVVDYWTQMEKEGKRGPNPALWWVNSQGDEVKWSFRELTDFTCRAANVFTQACGLQQGDHLALILPRVPEWWLVTMGCMRTGIVFMPGTTQMKAKDILYRLKESNAKSIVTTDALAPEVDSVASQCPALKTKLLVSDHSREGWLDFRSLIKSASPDHTCIKSKTTDPMVIFFTSGTTGFPKMAKHSHGLALRHSFPSCRKLLQLKPADVLWCLSDPGWLLAAVGTLFEPWTAGSTVFIHHLPQFDPKVIVETLFKYPITQCFAAPSVFRMILQQNFSSPQADAPSTEPNQSQQVYLLWRKLRMREEDAPNETLSTTPGCVTGDVLGGGEEGGELDVFSEALWTPYLPQTSGSPLWSIALLLERPCCPRSKRSGENGRAFCFIKSTDSRKRESHAALPGAHRSSPVPWGKPSRPSTSRDLPMVPTGVTRISQAEIIDDKGNILPPNTEGNLGIRMKPTKPIGLFMLYENDPVKTAKVECGDFYNTGDKATIDEEGYIWFLGRDDDIIKASGYRIGPTEVENALAEHPAVAESAVVSSPDPIRGQVVKAFIVLTPKFLSHDRDQLIKELQEHVKSVTAPYKYPRKVEFVPELPKTVTGKIKRSELREKEFGQMQAQ